MPANGDFVALCCDEHPTDQEPCDGIQGHDSSKHYYTVWYGPDENGEWFPDHPVYWSTA